MKHSSSHKADILYQEHYAKRRMSLISQDGPSQDGPHDRTLEDRGSAAPVGVAS